MDHFEISASFYTCWLQREPSVGKLWNLLGRLYEIHVAQSFGHLVFPAFLGTAGFTTKGSNQGKMIVKKPARANHTIEALNKTCEMRLHERAWVTEKMAAVVHFFAAPPFGGAGVVPFPADT